MTESNAPMPAPTETRTEAERQARIDQLVALIRQGRAETATLRDKATRIDRQIAQHESELGALRGAGSAWKVGDKVVTFHGAGTTWNADRIEKPNAPTFVPNKPAIYRIDRFAPDGTPILSRLRRDGSQGRSADCWMNPRDNDYVLVEGDDLTAAEAKLWQMWRDRMMEYGYTV